MDKILHLTRHAEAEHNVALDYNIPDAPLTKLGREQAARLNALTAQTIQQTADLLVSSPLSRTLQTTIIAYPGLRARLEAQSEPKGIITLSRLQEVNTTPCDVGSDKAKLEQDEEFAGIDFSQLEDDWNGKKGDFDPANVVARARWVRKWLRDRLEKEIVVVGHSEILRRITKMLPTQSWANAEVLQYTFKSADDEEADLIPIKSEEKTGEDGPSSSQLLNRSFSSQCDKWYY